MDQQKEVVILFADIMNSALLSYFLSPVEYDGILQQFGDCAKKSVAEIRKKYLIASSEIEWGCAGDELKAFIIPKNQDPNGIQNALKAAVDLAFHLKVGWLFSDSNTDRIKNQKAPTDLGVGINIGPVSLPK